MIGLYKQNINFNVQFLLTNINIYMNYLKSKIQHQKQKSKTKIKNKNQI